MDDSRGRGAKVRIKDPIVESCRGTAPFDPGGFMTIVRWWKLALLWTVSLILVSAMTAAAQLPREAAPIEDPLEGSTILMGGDVGFRLERVRDGVPIGHVVVRIDGRWVAPQAR
jgi:hypothetical protein